MKYIPFPKDLSDIVAKALSEVFEKSLQSGEISGNWEKGNILCPSLKRAERRLLKLSPCQPSLCAWGRHRTDPPGSCNEAPRGQGGDSGQPAWLYQGQVLPDHPRGFLQLSDHISGQGNGLDVISVKPLTWFPTASFSLNWRGMDSVSGVFGE